MIIVHKNLYDLAAGYDRIREIERVLPGRWRERLLIAYARKRQVYEQQRGAFSQRQALVKQSTLIVFGIIGAFSFSGLLLGLLQWFWGSRFETLNLYGWALQLLCCAGALAVLALFYGLTQWFRQPPSAPGHPLKTNLIAPLLPRWYDGLRGSVPTDQPTNGADAENRFVEFLTYLDDSYFVTYRLQLKPKGEIDVVLIGPKGIWLFEIKNWKGTIWYRDGIWKRPTADPSVSIKPFPHEQWQWVRDDLQETLRKSGNTDFLFAVPQLLNIRGGIVFTYDDAQRDIKDCPVNWGTQEFWKRTLEKIPMIPGIDEYCCLQVLDVLLKRHSMITGERPTCSMVRYADRVAHQAEAQLEAWIRR